MVTSARASYRAASGGQVLFELFAYSHFKARLEDGQPLTLSTDGKYGFSVASVPPGEHTVFLQYEPDRWQVLEWISPLVLVGFLGLLLRSLRSGNGRAS